MLKEDIILDLLKDIISHIKNELLLFSVVTIFLMALFKEIIYCILIIYVVASVLYALLKLTNKEKNSQYLEKFDNLLENSSWKKEIINDKEVLFCNDDNSYQIEIGEGKRDFTESWTQVYPDKNSSFLKPIYLKVEGVIIKEIPFISCDGGRILVPLPETNLIENKRFFQYNKNSIEYKLGKLIGYFYIYKTLEGVAKISNINII